MKIRDVLDVVEPYDIGSTREVFLHPRRPNYVIKLDPSGWYNKQERKWWKELKLAGLNTWVPHHYKIDDNMTAVERLSYVRLKKHFARLMDKAGSDLCEFNFMLADDGYVKLADLGSERWSFKQFQKFCNTLNQFNPVEIIDGTHTKPKNKR